LGSVFVKYLEPINVGNYLEATGQQDLLNTDIDKAALNLTETLLTEQQYATPVTLNSILAAQLL